jgi:hypothetical protein
MDLQKRPMAVAIHLLVIAMIGIWSTSSRGAGVPSTELTARPAACAQNDSHITLSPGFCATVFSDKIGHARHLVVRENGIVYVNTWSGDYYIDKKPPHGGFLVALQDTRGVGRGDIVRRFGEGVAQGSTGGTGIALYKGALYTGVYAADGRNHY